MTVEYVASKMIIRQANKDDAQRISYLIQKNAEHVKNNNYSARQIETWKAANSSGTIRKKLEERTIFCDFENKKLVGTIGLEGKEVVGLYVSYSNIGKGVGKALLNHLEEFAERNGIIDLELTSTPSAKQFYQKKGYSAQEEVLVNVNGVSFMETKMTKTLK